MTGIRMLRKLMVTLLISMSVAKQVSVKTQGDSTQHHPNSVYSQMHQKHSRKSADMKIFYQTGVRATIHKRSICIFISPSRTINGSSNYHSHSVQPVAGAVFEYKYLSFYFCITESFTQR